MAIDNYGGDDNVMSAALDAYAVTPHDTNALAAVPKALLVGGAGDIVLRAVNASADVTIAATAGMILPIRASHVRATGTTATGIIALA